MAVVVLNSSVAAVAINIKRLAIIGPVKVFGIGHLVILDSGMIAAVRPYSYGIIYGTGADIDQFIVLDHGCIKSLYHNTIAANII